MNKNILNFLVGAIAFILAGCAAFFSIAGLTKLFAGAAVAVIIMASALEISKLIIASVLYQYWNDLKKSLRTYLLIATVIIATITSIGIYGFLSNAYQTTKLNFELTQTKSDSLLTKKSYYQSTVENLKDQLQTKLTQLNNLTTIRNSQELQVNKLIDLNKSVTSIEKSSRRSDGLIKSINSDIDNLNSKITLYSDSVSKVNITVNKVSIENEQSSELGSISFVAKTLNLPMDTVVNFLILLFIIVFDPLAICMVLVYNFLLKLHNLPENEKSTPPKYDENQPDLPVNRQREQSLSETSDIIPIDSEQDGIRLDFEDERERIRREKIQSKLAKMYTGAVSADTEKTY